MKLRILTAVLFLFTANSVLCQNVKTDTVQRGYYIPFDSNFVSCKVAIAPAGGKVSFTNTTGNRLPDSLISKISYLEAGSVVVYSEVTVMKKGTLEKSKTVRYVVGDKNTGMVKRDPYYPDTMSAKEIGAIVLDQHVYQFSVSWFIGGSMYTYDMTGNGIFGSARTAIEGLPSGTKVYIENIRRKEDDGTLRIMPAEIHIVR
jgi:hypothetical protein